MRFPYNPILGKLNLPIVNSKIKLSNNEDKQNKDKKKGPLRPGPVIGPSGF